MDEGQNTRQDVAEDNLAAERDALTGWMEANAGQLQYSGGDEVKIPKLSVQGLANYDRDNGYAQGSVTLSYETYPQQHACADTAR